MITRRDALKFGLKGSLVFLGGCAGGSQGLKSLPDPLVDVRPARRNRRQLQKPLDLLGPPDETVVVPDEHEEWLVHGRIDPRWQCIVVHHSADPNASPQQMDDFHRNGRGWDELGYHFVIGNGRGYPDGQVFVGSRWPKQKHGAHCKTPDNFYNDHGVGICLIGNFERGNPSEAQMESLASLTGFLMRQGGISLNNVYTHRGVTGRTLCPGRHFDLPDLRRRLS